MGMKICKLLLRGTSYLYMGKPCECSYMCHLQQSIDNEPYYFPSNYEGVMEANAVVANFPSFLREEGKVESAQKEVLEQPPLPCAK
jgi:hypothetical protein